MKVFQIKYLQPKDTLYRTPNRMVTSYCGQREADTLPPSTVLLQECGREGCFEFVDGVCDNYDPAQIAERVSSHYEEKGLKVLRRVPDSASIDRSPILPVPSFILGG